MAQKDASDGPGRSAACRSAAMRRSAFRIVVWLAPIALPLLLSACVPPDSPGTSTAVPAPRYATYRCDGDNEITLENFRTSVHVVDTRGVDVELPAAPPDQTARYGQPGYALILERGTALWMVSGKRPVNCKRDGDPA